MQNIGSYCHRNKFLWGHRHCCQTTSELLSKNSKCILYNPAGSAQSVVKDSLSFGHVSLGLRLHQVVSHDKRIIRYYVVCSWFQVIWKFILTQTGPWFHFPTF